MSTMRTSALLASLGLVTGLPAQPGSSCSNALPANTNITIIAPLEDTWYSFTAPSHGFILAKTCGLSKCDTRLAVYDRCSGLVFDDAGLGSIAYNDDACCTASTVYFPVMADSTYYIRVRDVSNGCISNGLRWTMT